MENEEILQLLSKVDKKLDKLLKLTTTIAKTLHIVPVSEKEEREIQILQRKNGAVMQKVQEDIAELEGKPTYSNDSILNIVELYKASASDILGDIIGDEFDIKEN